MTAEPTLTTAPRKRRRWLQFSLRTLMLVMIPIACLAAWLGWEIEQGRRQYEAIAWIEKYEGIIEYHDPAPPVDWRQKLLGDRWPQPVLSVDFNPYYHSKDPRRFRRFPDGSSINAHITHIEPLGRLESIEEIVLNDTQVTDLRPLARLPQLRSLLMRNAPVSDLTGLAGLTNLTYLNFEGAPLQDLTALRELHHLEILILADTQVRDISPLENLQNLRTLWLTFTQVEDLTPLAGLTRLEKLDLAGTSVTNLKPLHQLTGLRELSLHYLSLRPEQVTELRRSLPHCEIRFSP